MARYDKYDPVSGGFRAPLASAIAAGSAGQVLGAGLDANGRVVVGGGTSGIIGALIVNAAKAAGDVVDVMTDGEIVDMPTGTTAGTVYFAAAADGAVSTTNTGTRIGHTAEATRLIVRVAR